MLRRTRIGLVVATLAGSGLVLPWLTATGAADPTVCGYVSLGAGSTTTTIAVVYECAPPCPQVGQGEPQGGHVDNVSAHEYVCVYGL